MPEERLPITFAEFEKNLNEAIAQAHSHDDGILRDGQTILFSRLKNRIRLTASIRGDTVIRNLFIDSLDIEVLSATLSFGRLYGKNDKGLNEHTDIVIKNMKISPESKRSPKSLTLSINVKGVSSFVVKESDFSLIDAELNIHCCENEFVGSIEQDTIELSKNKFKELNITHEVTRTHDHQFEDNPVSDHLSIVIKDNYVAGNLYSNYEERFIPNLSFIFMGNVIDNLLHIDYPKEQAYKVKIVSGNKINFIRFSKGYPNIVAWGLQESIGYSFEEIKKLNNPKKSREHIDDNKAELIQLIKLAHDKGDKFQAKTLEYHVSVFDDQLVSLESTRDFFQEKMIMRIGRWFSRHGTSWAKPLIIALSSSLLLAIIIQAVMCSGICVDPLASIRNLFYILFQFINPLGNPITISADLGYSYTSGGWPFIIILGLLLLGKLIYAICLYELFRAARRFTR